MNTRYRACSRHLSHDLSDSILVHRPATGETWRFSPTAAFAWTSLTTPRTLSEIEALMKSRFADTAGAVAHDAPELLRDFVQKGLVTAVPNGADLPPNMEPSHPLPPASAHGDGYAPLPADRFRGRQFSSEEQFLLDASNPHPGPGTLARLRDRCAAGLDWGWVIEAGAREAILPLIRQTAIRHGLRVADDARDALDRRVLAMATTHLVQCGELLRILPLLEAEGIRGQVLRGPALELQAYGNPGIRPSDDVDILVREADMEPACCLLRGQGYTPQTDGVELRRHLRHKTSVMMAGSAHGVPVNLDLHSQRFPAFVGVREATVQWRSVRLAWGDGVSIESPAPEDHLVLLCIHGAKHRWDRLIWIADLSALIAAHPALDWTRVVALSHALGGERICRLGLRLAAALHGAPVSDDIRRWVATDPAVAPLAEKVAAGWFTTAASLADKISRDGFLLQVRERLSDRVHILRRMVPDYMLQALRPNENDFALRLPDGMSICYYVMKPMRLFRTYILGHGHG